MARASDLVEEISPDVEPTSAIAPVKASPPTVTQERRRVECFDLFHEMHAAGHEIRYLAHPRDPLTQKRSLENFYLYGDTAAARKAFLGSQIDRLELKNANEGRRRELERSYVAFKNLQIEIPEREDFESHGLLVACSVGARVHSPGDANAMNLSGAVRRVVIARHVSEYWGLTKDNSLMKLNSQTEISFVQQNGLLYVSDGPCSTIGARLDVPLAEARRIHEQPRDYRMTVVVRGLEQRQEARWGHYLLKALIEVDYDCDQLVGWNRTGLFPDQPPRYFEVDPDKAPLTMAGMLAAVYVHTAEGHVLGSYVAPESDVELVLPVSPVTSLPPAAASLPKLKPPSDDELTKAKPRLLEELAKRGLSTGPDTTRLQRAEQIFALAKETNSDSPLQYLLAERSCELYLEAGDATSLMRVNDWLAERFELDQLQRKADALAKLSRAKLDSASADWTLAEIRKTSQEAVGQKRYDIASRLLTAAVNWARRTRSWATLRELEKEQQNVDRLRAKSNK